MRRAVLCIFALAAIGPVAAHDLITAESVQADLATQEKLQKITASPEPAAARAKAWLELGVLLDGIRELLNRDLEAHGGIQGLPSNFLISELKSRGTGLAYSADTNRFVANVQYYREALRLAPLGEVAAAASFRLLQGYFYDSFATDPLRASSQSQTQLAEQIGLGEELLKKYPQHAEREEASFILLVHYVQAARTAEQGRNKAAYARKARVTAGEFTKAYPESLRAAALPHLLEALPADR